MTCLCQSLWGNRMISSWFFQSFDLEEQPFRLSSQKAHLQQEQILLKDAHSTQYNPISTSGWFSSQC